MYEAEIHRRSDGLIVHTIRGRWAILHFVGWCEMQDGHRARRTGPDVGSMARTYITQREIISVRRVWPRGLRWMRHLWDWS